MRNALKTIITVMALLVSVAAVSAQQAGDDAKAVAEKLMRLQMDVMKPADIAQRMTEQMNAQLVSNLRQKTPGKDDAYYAKAAQVVSRVVNAVSQEQLASALPELQQSMVAMLTEHFTVDELNEMYRYQSSPTGRKAMEVTAREMPRLMQPFLQRMIQSSGTLAKRVQAALHSEGYDSN